MTADMAFSSDVIPTCPPQKLAHFKNMNLLMSFVYRETRLDPSA